MWWSANLSRQGIAGCWRSSLELNGGSIKSASSQPTPPCPTPVGTTTPDHKVDWQLAASNRNSWTPRTLQVAISASPASPEINRYAIPERDHLQHPLRLRLRPRTTGRGNGTASGIPCGTVRPCHFSANTATSIDFRLTVSYESGISDTSHPLTVTWVESSNRAPMPSDAEAAQLRQASPAR